MPIDKYFKGDGNDVMDKMQKSYGAKKGKQVFYATANKKGMKPVVPVKKKKKKRARAIGILSSPRMG